jgi:hypothetical protein
LWSVVAGTGAGLMSASPDRPAQPLAVIADGPGNLDREQLLDLVAGQRDQPGRWRPPVGRPCHRPRCAQAGSIGAGSRSIHPPRPGPWTGSPSDQGRRPAQPRLFPGQVFNINVGGRGLRAQWTRRARSPNLAVVSWEIKANLGRYARTGADAHGWLWEITRGAQVAQVVIEISGTAWSSDPLGLPEDTRSALQTDGRTELLKVLDQDDPPRIIRCGSSGCSYLSADEVE